MFGIHPPFIRHLASNRPPIQGGRGLQKRPSGFLLYGKGVFISDTNTTKRRPGRPKTTGTQRPVLIAIRFTAAEAGGPQAFATAPRKKVSSAVRQFVQYGLQVLAS